MGFLERVSDDSYRGVFVDLYVRCVNGAAIAMYEDFGYSVYRRVREYYDNLGLGMSARDEEDGFGECFILGMHGEMARGGCRGSMGGSGCGVLTDAVDRYAKTAATRSNAKVGAGKRKGYCGERARGAVACVWLPVVVSSHFDSISPLSRKRVGAASRFKITGVLNGCASPH